MRVEGSAWVVAGVPEGLEGKLESFRGSIALPEESDKADENSGEELGDSIEADESSHENGLWSDLNLE